jgi:membrane protein
MPGMQARVIGRFREWLRSSRSARVIVNALKGYDQHRLVYMAAAISFYAMISLIPIAYLALLALTIVVGSSEMAQEQLRATLSEYLLRQTVNDLMDRVNELNTAGLLTRSSAWWIVLAFLWSGLSFYESLQSIFTAAWGGAQGRRYWQRKLGALIAFTAAALFFGMTIVFSTSFATVSVVNDFFGLPLAPFWYLLGRVVPYLLAIVIFFLLYKFLPNAQVQWKVALYTAIPVGILWEITKQVFTQILVAGSMYSSVYGPMAGFAVLMIWIYWSSNVVLLGAEFGAAWQRELEPYFGEVG